MPKATKVAFYIVRLVVEAHNFELWLAPVMFVERDYFGK